MFIYEEKRIKGRTKRVVRSPLEKMRDALNFRFNTYKNRLLLFMLVLFDVEAQTKDRELPETVHPIKGTVIAVVSTMFAIAFLLLLYVKFYRYIPHELVRRNPNFQGLTRSRSSISGIEKHVVETLPFFKFSSLKGSKEGLECMVCLSKFEDTETLRLVPKCKHAFHVNCIDKWFESHSTCPLCRSRVEAGDVKTLNCSLSSRFLRVPSNLTEDPNVEMLVQREAHHGGSSRRGICDKRGHVMNHKIVVSDVVARSRWSDLNSSDLLWLKCEMLGDMWSMRNVNLASSSNEEENGCRAVNPGEKRCVSEIANVPRFAETGRGNNEKLRRVWLPIARGTVQWFAKRERDSLDLEHKTLASNV